MVALTFAVSVITGPANSFVFLYAQNVLHQRGIVTAGMIVGAGPAACWDCSPAVGWPITSGDAPRAHWLWCRLRWWRRWPTRARPWP